jgi:hypothetical protein
MEAGVWRPEGLLPGESAVRGRSLETGGVVAGVTTAGTSRAGRRMKLRSAAGMRPVWEINKYFM